MPGYDGEALYCHSFIFCAWIQLVPDQASVFPGASEGEGSLFV